ncbi:phosphotransferase [Microbacterium aurantiacum]|uniref:phosphotransferase n=1 Tax=Microbacterium aurantiacum TaxID=162393 RepID=UPI003D73C365
MVEEELAGGNASGAVVRVGDTVRKPWTASTASVQRFVDGLRDAGVDAAAPLGRDDEGRQVLEFVPGRLAIDGRRLSRAELQRVGSMVRQIHDASQNFTPDPDDVWETAIAAPGDDLVCHNDLAPWNLIIGERWVFIDWDASAPSTRLWDLAYAAQAFALNDPARSVRQSARDLRAFVDGYRAGPALRADLPMAMTQRTAAMYDLLRSSHAAGNEPWASMFTGGHGEHWSAAGRYVTAHQKEWLAALTRPERR